METEYIYFYAYYTQNQSIIVNGLGCNDNVNLNFIYHSSQAIDRLFINRSNILPSGNLEKEYEVIETELFQILKS